VLSYWVAVIARNAAATLETTLNSILSQTLRPEQVIVVDDGSTDGTSVTLLEYVHAHRGLLKVITLPDKGYDIRRVPANINRASKLAEKESETDFFMISGDDCSYPRDYVESLIRRMLDEPQIVVASGRPSSTGMAYQEHTPSGSGRMIRCRNWREIGGEYPIRAGWETWLLYKAEEKGFKVKLFDDLLFNHARPRGAKHQFVYWGAAMQTLGYHPLYAIGRIAKNAMARSIAIRGSLNVFRGYLQACLGSGDSFIAPFEPSLRKFVRSAQAYRIMNIVSALV
jgi:glycosyltransferase involved in cell wall biosynthesis